MIKNQKSLFMIKKEIQTMIKVKNYYYKMLFLV